jgi:site-specific DNA-methyltransferase (adenine-specific)
MTVLQGDRRWLQDQGAALSMLQKLQSGSVDMVLTDPPYSSGGAYRTDRAGQSTNAKYTQSGSLGRYADFAGDNRDQRGYLVWCSLWLTECLRVAKSGAPIAVFSDWRQLPVTTDAVQAGGWVWRGIVPWDKTEACRPQKGRFSAQSEYVVWGSKGPMPTERGVPPLRGVYRHRVDPAEKHHIAGKPTALMLDLVKICIPGGVVLDPFSGSASTGVAALRTGRRFVGFEISEHWNGIARERLEAECGVLDITAARAGQMSLLGDVA